MTSYESPSMAVCCPSCQRKGKKVKPRTLHALLQEEYRTEVVGYDRGAKDAWGCTPTNEETVYRFCDSQECEVAYFSETTEQVFRKSQLRVSVGVKETSGARPLCYCFGHSVTSIKEELLATGRSIALEDIREKMKVPGCRCETENPSGACCLGSVAQGIQTAREELGMRDGVAVSTDGAKNAPSARGETIAKVGTLVSAIMASACCWLPLVLLAVGVSGAGMASVLEAYRPLFVVVTFSFLAAAFYYTYRPKKLTAGGGAECCAAKATEEAEACCSPASKGRLNMLSMNKIMLWGVTVMATAFLLFPNYVGAFLGGDGRAVTANMHRSVFTIEGMTCEGCSEIAAQAIRGVPGVLAVEVSYATGQAVIGTEACCAVPQDQLHAAIEGAGYRGTLVENLEREPPLPKRVDNAGATE